MRRSPRSWPACGLPTWSKGEECEAQGRLANACEAALCLIALLRFWALGLTRGKMAADETFSRVGASMALLAPGPILSEVSFFAELLGRCALTWQLGLLLALTRYLCLRPNFSKVLLSGALCLHRRERQLCQTCGGAYVQIALPPRRCTATLFPVRPRRCHPT